MLLKLLWIYVALLIHIYRKIESIKQVFSIGYSFCGSLYKWIYLCILGVIGVHMLETMDGEITLEMETQWEGNCSCILSVGLPMGISLPAEVGSLPTFVHM